MPAPAPSVSMSFSWLFLAGWSPPDPASASPTGGRMQYTRSPRTLQDAAPWGARKALSSLISEWHNQRRMRISQGSCSARTRAGKPCSAPATASGYCNIHSRPDRAAALGRLGGKKNRHTPGPGASQDCHAPESADEVKQILADAIAGVRCGRVDPRIGNAIAYMATPLLKAFETAELEQRLLKMEEEFKERQ